MLVIVENRHTILLSTPNFRDRPQMCVSACLIVHELRLSYAYSLLFLCLGNDSSLCLTSFMLCASLTVMRLLCGSLIRL